MKSALVVGNWKMHAVSISDAHILATTIRNNVANFSIEVVVCPPAIWLSEVAAILKKGKVKLGAQNIYAEPEGAYTGEISALMVKEMAEYVIIGHSERREYFGETNFEINEKIITAFRAGLKPILCIGEKNKKGNLSQPMKELHEAINGVPKKYLKDLIVAYEPVWAVGTGVEADAEYVAKVATKFREILHRDSKVLYGGSVTSKNTKDYANRPEIDGVFVGGASVRSSEFIKICDIWNKTRQLKID